MQQAIIKLAWKQEIGKSSVTDFDQNVWPDSYMEFCMQAQAYFENGRYQSFSEMIAGNPKAASLHYKVGFSVGLYLRQLGELMPGTQDTLQQVSLTFESCEFTLLESHLQQSEAHRVALTYTSKPLVLLGVIGNQLLLAHAPQSLILSEPISTFMVRLNPGIAIVSYQVIQGSVTAGESKTAAFMLA